mgnify:CR=1 FL=1
MDLRTRRASIASTSRRGSYIPGNPTRRSILKTKKAVSSSSIMTKQSTSSRAIGMKPTATTSSRSLLEDESAASETTTASDRMEMERKARISKWEKANSHSRSASTPNEEEAVEKTPKKNITDPQPKKIIVNKKAPVSTKTSKEEATNKPAKNSATPRPASAPKKQVGVPNKRASAPEKRTMSHTQTKAKSARNMTDGTNHKMKTTKHKAATLDNGDLDIAAIVAASASGREERSTPYRLRKGGNKGNKRGSLDGGRKFNPYSEPLVVNDTAKASTKEPDRDTTYRINFAAKAPKKQEPTRDTTYRMAPREKTPGPAVYDSSYRIRFSVPPRSKSFDTTYRLRPGEKTFISGGARGYDSRYRLRPGERTSMRV